MSESDLAIRGGVVVSARGRARLDVHIADGLVVHVGPGGPPARRSIDASGLMVLPGMVDTHVHLMDPGDTSREDFPTGTAAAAARGVTTIVEHTHSHPVRTVAEMQAKLDHLRGRAQVDFGLAAHAWPGHFTETAELFRAGITFFKVFTCTTHGVPGLDTAQLREAFDHMAVAGAPALVHCEDGPLTDLAEHTLREAGRNDNGLLPEWRNREAELVAVQLVTLLARLTGTRVTVAHVSNPEVARIIAAARVAGADVVGEACPQYFLLREDEVLEQGTLRKFTPPARSRSAADEDEMWDLLRTGVLHHVSTDHAPSTLEQKNAGDIWDAHFGLPGLDTTLPLLLDAAARGRLGLEDIVRVYAERPAARYRLRNKGHLGVGADADLVLVDPSSSWTVRRQDVISRAGWSPYEGRRIQGSVVATFLRGQKVAGEGRCEDLRSGVFVPGPGATAGTDPLFRS